MVETTTNGESELKVRLFAESFAPDGAEGVPASVYDRLQRLKERGTIADCEVEVWGRKVCRQIQGDSPTICAPVLDTVDEFREWAARTGNSLDHCFHEYEVHSELTDEDRTEVRLPMVCLAVYYGSELVAVFPHASGEGERSVADGLETLESTETRSNQRPERIVH